MKKAFSELDERERLNILVAIEHLSGFNLLIFLHNQENRLSFDEVVKKSNMTKRLCETRLNGLLRVNLTDYTYPMGYHITDLGKDVLREFLERKNDTSKQTVRDDEDDG